MANESHTQLPIADQFRFVSLARSRCDRGVADQATESPRALAKNRVLKTRVQHLMPAEMLAQIRLLVLQEPGRENSTVCAMFPVPAELSSF